MKLEIPWSRARIRSLSSASHYGWAFADPEDPPLVPPSGHGEISSGVTIPDPLHGFKMVRDIYDMAAGAGTLKKYTVPILWDEKVGPKEPQDFETGTRKGYSPLTG